jgi:hypothetical protein
MEPVIVDEFRSILEATYGNGKLTEAGIRLRGQKYIFVKNDEATNSAYLAR